MMAEYSRTAVQSGEMIRLRTVFLDSAGNLIAPDALPDIYIYDSSVDSEIMELEIEAGTYDSALVGPVVPTLLSTGYYEYQYTVPGGAVTGIWYDIWVAEVNTVEVKKTLSFFVQETITLDVQDLKTNTMIVIELDSTIASVDENTLGEDIQLYFTTVYDPLYASPDLVRLEVGSWINYLPDDSIALMIHWASKEAEFIQGPRQESYGNIKLARTKFVIFDTALRCAMQMANLEAGASNGGKKQLGDLLIQKGETITQPSGSILDYLRQQRREWERVVNAGGNIVPGQGFAPTTAEKGLYDPNRRLQGRLWDSPRDVHYTVPTVNEKRSSGVGRKAKWSFYERY